MLRSCRPPAPTRPLNEPGEADRELVEQQHRSGDEQQRDRITRRRDDRRGDDVEDDRVPAEVPHPSGREHAREDEDGAPDTTDTLTAFFGLERALANGSASLGLTQSSEDGGEDRTTIEIGRRLPSACQRRSVEIFSSPGQSSCLSITAEGFSVKIRRRTPGVICTVSVSG